MDKRTRVDLPGELGQEPPQRDWKDTLAAATDLALIGFCAVGVGLAVVTLGSAAATGSYAVRYWIIHRRTPPVGEVGRLFLRWLLPGLLTSVAVAATAWLLALNLTAISRGAVPGGAPALVATGVVATWCAAVVVLTLVHLGRWPGSGWLSALRWAAVTATLTPHWALVLLLVAGFATALGVTIQATSPLMVGYGLFAVHVVADRLLPEDPQAG
ncbi:MAG: hypothetical protein JXA67_20235 [Micromonosporaceae bacterium]|nr:hypothetical protein [Micromonosporaceae bacterium]